MLSQGQQLACFHLQAGQPRDSLARQPEKRDLQFTHSACPTAFTSREDSSSYTRGREIWQLQRSEPHCHIATQGFATRPALEGFEKHGSRGEAPPRPRPGVPRPAAVNERHVSVCHMCTYTSPAFPPACLPACLPALLGGRHSDRVGGAATWWGEASDEEDLESEEEGGGVAEAVLGFISRHSAPSRAVRRCRSPRPRWRGGQEVSAAPPLSR